MKEFNTPLNDLDIRSRYALDIKELFNKNGINWGASSPVTRPEIFIRPNGDYEWQNFPAITRISLQIKEDGDPKGIFSFGVSGYNPLGILDTYGDYQRLGYEYHDKDGNKTPKEATEHYRKGKASSGRWWLTKRFNNIENITNEIREIEPLLYR